jgi:outer membrane immunogenic protein
VNGQWGGLVAGVEADFNWLGGGNRNGSLATGNFFFGEGLDAIQVSECEDGVDCILYNGSVSARGGHSNWVSTVRGRVGAAFDRFLVYGTAGLAIQGGGTTRTETTLTRTDFEDFPLGEMGRSTVRYSMSSDRNQFGWAAGVGAEWAFLNNMSLGLEYLHVDFGSHNVVFVDPVLTAAGDQRALAGDDPEPEAVHRRVKVRDTVDFVRLKLNVRF